LYGLVNSKSVLAGMNFNLSNPDLEKRMEWFVWNCFGNAIQQRQYSDPSIAKMWTQQPNDATASLYNPFSPENIRIYTSSPMLSQCKAMVQGGYSFNGAVQKGNDYPFPVGVEVQANLAFQDARIRQAFHWSSVSQAAADIPLVIANPDLNKTLDTLLARSFTGAISRMQLPNDSSVVERVQAQNTSQGGWLTLGPWRDLLANMGGAAVQLATTAKDAGQAAAVNMEVPLWSSYIQLFLLSLFPITILIAVFPGKWPVIVDFFLALAWAKSYALSWAMAANVDKFLSNLELGGLHLAERLAFTHSIQQMQIFGWALCFILPFGVRQGIQGMARGGGAA